MDEGDLIDDMREEVKGDTEVILTYLRLRILQLVHGVSFILQGGLP